MSKILALICAAVALLSQIPVSAAAGAPIAVVESVSGKVDGVEFMDYVSAGQVIQLGAKDSIVLSYMQSCVRETITGGTVIIVESQSLVQGGSVERVKVACDSKMKLNSGIAAQSAGAVFRSGPRPESGSKAPQLTLFGQSPIVEINNSGQILLIERLDAAGKPLELAIASDTLVQGRFIDLAKSGISLTPGATYSAKLGSATVEFRIASDAKPGATPIIGRLLQFN